MRGLRKFYAFIMTLFVFTLIALLNKSVDLFNLGLALTGILGAFGVSNAMVHIKGTGKQEEKE